MDELYKNKVGPDLYLNLMRAQVSPSLFQLNKEAQVANTNLPLLFSKAAQ